MDDAGDRVRFFFDALYDESVEALTVAVPGLGVKTLKPLQFWWESR